MLPVDGAAAEHIQVSTIRNLIRHRRGGRNCRTGAPSSVEAGRTARRGRVCRFGVGSGLDGRSGQVSRERAASTSGSVDTRSAPSSERRSSITHHARSSSLSWRDTATAAGGSTAVMRKLY
jgi:hypothetical protein